MFGTYQGFSTLTGLTANIQRNIITNSVDSCYQGVCSGGGIANLIPKRYTVTCSENCLYNNQGGNLYQVTDQKAVIKDPLFVGNGDYHLKSTNGHYTPNGYVKDSVTSPVLYQTYELGRYAGTSECSIPSTLHLSPIEIIGNSYAVIILCSSENEVTALSEAIKVSAILTDEKMVIYNPN